MKLSTPGVSEKSPEPAPVFDTSTISTSTTGLEPAVCTVNSVTTPVDTVSTRTVAPFARVITSEIAYPDVPPSKTPSEVGESS